MEVGQQLTSCWLKDAGLRRKGGRHRETARGQSWIAGTRPAFVSANLLMKRKPATAAAAAAVGEGGHSEPASV